MNDLTQYSENELSMMVFNDEYLYSIRHESDALKDTIQAYFRYTNEQYNVLMDDIADDLEEIES